MIRRLMIATVFVTGLAVSFPTQASAQFVVYDPTNYAQAVTRYLQLVQQYQFWLRQARRLPVDMARRYRVPEVKWRTHDNGVAFPYARPILTGLNSGDPAGALYFQSVDKLEPIELILNQLPASLRQRLKTRYGTIELADSIATMSIHQSGAIRFNGRRVLEAIEDMEDDLVAAPEEYHSQAALLNKINGASVLGLRIAERSSQFLMHTLEQLLLENKRKRDAESQIMNAHISQWRYGRDYASGLFEKTAGRLDGWKQP